MNKFFAGSSFLCNVCRKVMGMLNHLMKEMEAKMRQMEAKLLTAELKRKVMAEKITSLE